MLLHEPDGSAELCGLETVVARLVHCHVPDSIVLLADCGQLWGAFKVGSAAFFLLHYHHFKILEPLSISFRNISSMLCLAEYSKRCSNYVVHLHCGLVTERSFGVVRGVPLVDAGNMLTFGAELEVGLDRWLWW